MKYQPLRIGNLIAPVPIVQGGMGIGISLGGLAGAVAKEGGVGIISAAQIGYQLEGFTKSPFLCNLQGIANELAKARHIAPDGIIGFNIMVAMKHYDDYVIAAAKAGADLIISGAGIPTNLPELVEGYKTKIAPIVSTDKSARVILKYWDRKYQRTADLLVIEGPKAGGHLGFTNEQLKIYEDVNHEGVNHEGVNHEGVNHEGVNHEGVNHENAKHEMKKYEDEIRNIIVTKETYESKYNCKIPVVVAGGIATPEDMERVMALGADGIQVGSRFVTTEECDASDIYKEAYIRATKEDIQIVKSPVGMPGRAIMNPFMKRIMAGEMISPETCLQCLHHCKPAEIPYCISHALIQAAKGNIEDGLLFCGSEAYRATKINKVKDVVDYYMGN